MRIRTIFILSILLSTQVLSHHNRSAGSVADSVFTNIAFYYGDKYVSLRDLMDKECNTLTSFILDTCKKENFESYYQQSSLIKEDVENLQEKVRDAERSNDFSSNKFTIALNNYLEDLSLVVDALIYKTDWLSRVSHSMVDTGQNPLESKADKSPLTLIESSKALLELKDEFTVLSNKENSLLLDVQLSADRLLSITRN